MRSLLAAFVAAAIADDQPKPTKTAKPVGPDRLCIAGRLITPSEKKAGQEPLKLSEKLTRAALLHAKDMAEHHKLDHTGTDKSTVAERVKRQDYPYILVGENIAFGQKDVDEVMTTWMESPGHRENILANFTEMGGARSQGREGVYYWCVDFGTPIPQLKPKRGGGRPGQVSQWRPQGTREAPSESRAKAGQGRHADQRSDGQERYVQARRRPVQIDRGRSASRP